MAEESQMPPGQAAIEAALEKVLGKNAGMVLHRPIPRILGGPDVIDDFYQYKLEEPVPHWHLVTAGLTELYDKQSKNPAVSGFGFEFSLRVRWEEGESASPNWASNFLENVAKYVYESGNGFAAGHTMNLNSPIAQNHETAIHAMAMRVDPVLGEVESPNGKFAFLQIIGLTLDELDSMKAWTSEGVLGELLAANALGIIDLNRKSLLTDPVVAERIRERTLAEGSGTDGVSQFTKSPRMRGGWFGGKRLDITLAALDIGRLAIVLRGRIPFGRPLRVWYEDGVSLVLLPAESCSWRQNGKDIEISMTRAAAAHLADKLIPHSGEFVIPELSDVIWRIERTVIRDQKGKPTETVG